jgi:MFS family permease
MLLQHLGGYAELGAAAATEYRSAWVRRALLGVVGTATAMAGLGALWAAGLVALWDTAWRLMYLGGSAVVLLLVSVLTLYLALARQPAGPTAGVLKTELRKDMELFHQWKSTL